MEQNSNYYILIDFNATKRFSHHWTYLDKYKTFLENSKYEYEIWVPKNADVEILKALGGQCSGFLRSNMYGYERKHNLSQWIVEKLINFVLINFVKKLPEKYSEIIKHFFSLIYLYVPLKRVKKLRRQYNKIILVFPTTDSLAIRFLILCLTNDALIYGSSLRTIGVASKDGFAIYNTENKFANLIKKYPECKIVLGWETMPYMNLLIDNGIPKSNIAWAPVPHDKKLSLTKSINKFFTLGFLGTARPNKGFESIPDLIDALVSKGIEFHAIVQRAVYPWQAYTNALNRLQNSSPNVEIVDANLSGIDFQKVFSTIDLLVLPYKIESYLSAGSGLLFTAADLDIPTLAKRGVAFSWDISEYNLGFLYSNNDEFVCNVEICIRNLKKFEFARYNADRNLHFKSFLQT